MQYFFLILFLTSTVLATQPYSITPIGNLQLRFEDVSKKQTPLGKIFLKENSIDYHDYIVGGIFGIKSSLDNYELKIAFLLCLISFLNLFSRE